MARPPVQNPGDTELPPADRDRRRAELAGRIATIVLAEGLEALALRGLAARLSTSGRMLLYYFGTKDALVIQTLRRVSDRLTDILAARPQQEKVSSGQFLAAALAVSADPVMAPYMRVWTEVIARGARGEAPYQGVAAETVGAWLAWIESRLVADPADSGNGRAAAILSIVEGVSLLEAARPGTTGHARNVLVRAMDTAPVTTGKLRF